MSENRPHPSQDLESYLDGQLSGEPRARFEDQIARDPELRVQVARQAEIDRALRRSFVVTGSADSILAGMIAQPHSGNGRAHRQEPGTWNQERGHRFIRPRLAIAAAIIFLVCGPFAVYFAWDAFHAETLPTITVYPKTVEPLDKLYEREVKEGFNCDWQCKSQNEFGAYFAAGFGEPLMMRDPPKDVLPVGLKYVGGITPNTISYMAKVNDQPVMVFADKSSSDKGQMLTDPALHLFKRTIGQLVLYEVTPLNEPKLLELFYKP